MDGFRDLVGTDVAPVSKKAAVKDVCVQRKLQYLSKWNDSMA